MILNIENYTVKIDFEARTVEVAQAPLNVETETLAQAVERVSQPTLNQWVPTDAEMVEMHREMNPEIDDWDNPDNWVGIEEALNPEPSQFVNDLQCLDDFELHFGRMATLEEATELFGERAVDVLKNWSENNPIPRATRKPRAVETQPREICRSTCCGTLGRRTRNGSCAGCRGMTDEERETLSATNHALLYAVGVSL